MKKLVYTAMSRHSSYAKEIVCAHVFINKAVPLNPFSMFGYFLFDMVDRDLVRHANERVISAVDEIWVYGPISDGCLAEIRQAKEEQKPIRFFTVDTAVELIREVEIQDLSFEGDDLRAKFTLL